MNIEIRATTPFKNGAYSKTLKDWLSAFKTAETWGIPETAIWTHKDYGYDLNWSWHETRN